MGELDIPSTVILLFDLGNDLIGCIASQIVLSCNTNSLVPVAIHLSVHIFNGCLASEGF
jgi:hypothetical protein